MATYYPEECTQDLDCNPYIYNRLCYHGAVWLDQQDANSSECLCNVFYGWEGNNCDEYGTGTMLSVTLYAVFGLVSLILLLKGILQLHRRSKASPSTRYVPLTSANTTLLFVVMGLAGAAFSALFTILNFVDLKGTPADFLVTNRDSFGRYEWITRNIGLPVLGLPCTLSQLNLCLTWLDLARTSNQLLVSTRKNLGRSRKVVVIFEILLLVSIVVGLIIQTINGASVISILSVPFATVTIVLYLLGATQIHSLIKSMMGGTKANDKMRKDIYSTTLAIIVTDLVFIGAQIGIAVTTIDEKIYRDTSMPGRVITVEKVCHHLVFVGFSMSNFILWRYLSHLNYGTKKLGAFADSPRLSDVYTNNTRLGSKTRLGEIAKLFRVKPIFDSNDSKGWQESPNPRYGDMSDAGDDGVIFDIGNLNTVQSASFEYI